ncbi:MAG: DUF4091 domain-containing protein [Bacteroidaceae bacterium]|nr:DUF4091 domain-containing protein [Bacteroidaceae bacterium]
MKKKHFLFLLFTFIVLRINAQVNNSEPADPKPGPQEAWQQLAQPTLGWGTTDVRYSRSQVPETTQKPPVLRAWRGERVSAQAVIATPVDLGEVSFEVSDLRCGKNTIPASAVKKYFVRYVLTETYGNRKDSFLMADRLDPVETLKVEACTARPLWLDIHVPEDAKPGTYKGTLKVRPVTAPPSPFRGSLSRQELPLKGDGGSVLPIELHVADRTLPAPSEWSFHLDLWQNPYSVARYYEVPLWSQQHFDLMRPTMELLAAAGQKVITCSVISRPWNGQTFDPFESMIGKTKELDGSWHYDYTVFDRWVEFMMSCGITEQIDCYTLVPWHYRFDYYDRATNSVCWLSCRPGEQAYHDFIVPFLKDLSRHLRQKGWFSRTYIAMDERPKDQMEAAWRVIQEADPEFKIEGAANYSVESEAADRVDDLSVAFQYNLLKGEALAKRTAKGQKITFYTCCSPDRPNTFTFSPPAESAYLGLHAAACGYDGYLRWAYNSWTEQPCQDSRFPRQGWYSGDCYLAYPGGSSIRMERLVEGIQAYEKVRLLRPELNLKQAKQLDEMLRFFGSNKYEGDTDAAGLLRQMNDLLWKLSR